MAAAHPIVADIYADKTLHDVLIASGYGVTISVRGGHLIVTDGIGQCRRERRVPRLPRTVQRLTILGHTGYMSLESVRWLSDAGIPWCQLDDDGRVIATSGPQRTDSRLMRAQAFAPHDSTGLAITRMLLLAKLQGQADVLRDVIGSPGAAVMVSEYADELRHAGDLDACRMWEAQAAVTCFAVWADRVTVPFSPRDLTVVPSHWLRFAGRASMVNESYQKNNHASDPVNAAINYLAWIAEAEAVRACHALGLSPSLGILHADKPGRDSMALDLIECARPALERIVLGMMDCGLGVPVDASGRAAYPDRRWFSETRDGQCRLVPPLTHRLAGHAAYLGSLIYPYAERAARMLASAAPGDVRLPYSGPSRKVTPPPSSKMPARLRDGVTASDLLPDAVWEQVCALIPAPPAKRGRGRPAGVDDRAVIAALIAHEMLAVPWGFIPVPVSKGACRGRLLAWQWSQAGQVTAWDRICEVVRSAGHLRRLLYSDSGSYD